MDSQTDTALQLQIGVLEALLQLLHQEGRCLQSGIMTELEPIAAEKERLYQTISALESQRRTQPSTVTRMGLQAQRRALLEKIVQHNQQNGQSIGSSSSFLVRNCPKCFCAKSSGFIYTPAQDGSPAGHRY